VSPARRGNEHPYAIRRVIRFLGRVKEYCRALGMAQGLRWYFGRALGHWSIPRTPHLVMWPGTLLHPVVVAMKTTDEFVFDQIFVRCEYTPICKGVKNPEFILDLGANVGFASALFASRYPAARILAVEPDPRNFALCQKNLKVYGTRAQVLKGAVWSCCTRLDLSYENGDGWGTRVNTPSGSDGGKVTAWDLPALLQMFGIDRVDLLKIDIEGSEAELFAHNTGWLSRARNICIELHGGQCREIFFNALSGFDYELVEAGESTLCLNIRSRTANRKAPLVPSCSI
jgi:FkbM family methyltransferase